MIKWRVILQLNENIFCANIGGVSKVCFVSAGIEYKLCGLANSQKFCVFFADAVIFLSDPQQSGFITGQDIVIDGGLTLPLVHTVRKSKM